MAMEWDVRVERGFTLESVRSATALVLADLLGLDKTPAVSFTETGTAERRGAGLTSERLAAIHGPHSSDEEHAGFHLAEGDATIWVMITDVGFHEDEDAGVRCSVTCRRDPLSIVLGVAAIIAIARVAGRAVWDEALLLGHERVNDPGFLMNALRVSETPDLETATRSLLARTAIRLPDRTADRLCQEP